MQRKKVYNVSLCLDLHAITCPGVWLCPKGKVAVRVAIFGVSETTKKLPPSFPLFYHERFHFQKKYKKVSNLHQVERVLHRAPVVLELFQYPPGTSEAVKLAEFKATIGDIIYPPGGDMDLLFSTTDTFPGIIGPKGEVTTCLTLTEGGTKDNIAAPTTVLSKGTRGKQIEDPVIRQKPVCHTKHYLYCNCFDKNAPSQMFSKAMKKRKDLMAKKRISQEIIRQVSPAHVMSHKNHGDIIPGYEELADSYDGNVNVGICTCCHQEDAFRRNSNQAEPASEIGRCMCGTEQTVFRALSNETSPRISEESFLKEKNMKDGYMPPAEPQPKWDPPIEEKLEKIQPEVENNNVRKRNDQCCLCCPRVPDLYRRKKSPTVISQRQETQYNPLEVKKYEEKKYQPDTGEEQKYPISPCPLCEHNNKLINLMRKKTGEMARGSKGQPLFYSNLCKAYERLMHEYCSSFSPPSVNSRF